MPSQRLPASSAADLRVDRFLHCIRFAKSRTLAQAIIAEGHVRIAGKRVCKPNAEVRIGDVVALPVAGRVRVIRVRALPARRGPAAEAQACFEEVAVDDPVPRS